MGYFGQSVMTEPLQDMLDETKKSEEFKIQDMWYLATGWNDPHRTLYQDGITIDTKKKTITNAPSLKEMAQREEFTSERLKRVMRAVKEEIE